MITTDCAAGTFCHWVTEATGKPWLGESSNWLLLKPLRIIGIVVVALIIRALVYRLIRRMTVGLSPAILNPLREKALTEVGLLSERRRQRAGTIGSLLRSTAGAIIVVIAGMMVLSEMGLNLGPLLASAGIAGVALGFGAQSLVKDILSGIFMLLEDQYGVGDSVDLGEASGTVESVGLRVTTVRDVRGVQWYVRNGEIVRVGNRSQGWAMIVLDVPIGNAPVDEAIDVIRDAVLAYAALPDYAADFMEAPSVLGVEQLTIDGAVLRVTAKTQSEAQWRVGRELRGVVTSALKAAGIDTGRNFPRLPDLPAS